MKTAGTEQRWDKVIVADKKGQRYWADLWDFRGLFFFLVWRDILVRYKQTVFGIAWSIIRPVLTMVVFSVVFGRIAKLPDGGTPYPILVYAAMLPWQFFSSSFSASTMSMISNVNLVSKIYFPRLIIPTATMMVSVVDFVIAFIIYVLLMFFYSISFSWRMLFLPLFMLMALLSSIGPGVLVSAIAVKYRDFKYIVPFITQLGLYISPVGFKSDIIPDRWRLVYSLNPLVGVIDGFRWALLGGENTIYVPGIILSSTVIILFLIWGIWYFRRAERYFADVI